MPTQKKLHDKIVFLVSSLITLYRQLSHARSGQAKVVLERQIESTDRRIDELVYELYGLSDEEIKIVEGGKG